MVWPVLLTPAAFLALILTLDFVERRLFGEPGDPRVTPGGRRSRATPAGSDRTHIPRSGATRWGRQRSDPDLTRPIEVSPRSSSRPHRARRFRFLGSSHIRSAAGSAVVISATAPRPAVSPKTPLDVENLLPGTVSKIAPGDCVRCGGDFSRGFAPARDSAGEDEGALVCLSCGWLDDAERESLRQAAETDAPADPFATPPADRSG